jgi:hypothetical protein
VGLLLGAAVALVVYLIAHRQVARGGAAAARTPLRPLVTAPPTPTPTPAADAG